MDYVIKSLDETTAYENEHVVTRFCDLFDVSEEESSDLFKDCLRWLWLAAVAQSERRQGLSDVPPKLAIDDSLGIIDEMWHNFLCFTRDYQEFCKTYFGVFIHHNPTTIAYNESLKSQIKVDPTFQRHRREGQYNYIYDKLGEEVLLRWYEYYDKQYSNAVILKLRKK